MVKFTAEQEAALRTFTPEQLEGVADGAMEDAATRGILVRLAVAFGARDLRNRADALRRAALQSKGVGGE